MEIQITPSPEAAAARAAQLVATGLTTAIGSRGRASLAVSGGSTPAMMIRELAHGVGVPWGDVDVFQVDERIAPDGDPARNLALLDPLFDRARPPFVYPMPVADASPQDAADAYQARLAVTVGEPAQLDVVHLGLGTDGHTASLVPDDPVVQVIDRDVAITNPYAGHQRMTLTRPLLDRARLIVWLVTGESKQEPLRKLMAVEPGIPATLLSQRSAIVIADEAAAGLLR